MVWKDRPWKHDELIVFRVKESVKDIGYVNTRMMLQYGMCMHIYYILFKHMA